MIRALNGKALASVEAQNAAIDAYVRSVSGMVVDAKLSEALGPFAALFREFMARQQALEDHVGFTYQPPAAPAEPAKGTDE